MNCLICGDPIPVRSGRRPKFCSNRCRQRAHRDKKRRQLVFPARMRQVDQWARAKGKVPYQVSGVKASSTRPSSWTSFCAVQDGVGDGFGVFMGEGLAVFDLDHALHRGRLKPWAREVISGIEFPILFAEVSLSGEGLHVFVEAGGCRGRREAVGDGGVEFYSQFRFVRCTGVVFDLDGVRA